MNLTALPSKYKRSLWVERGGEKRHLGLVRYVPPIHRDSHGEKISPFHPSGEILALLMSMGFLLLTSIGPGCHPLRSMGLLLRRASRRPAKRLSSCITRNVTDPIGVDRPNSAPGAKSA